MRPTEAKVVFLVVKVDHGGGSHFEVYATEKQANLACENYNGTFAYSYETPVRRTVSNEDKVFKL